MKVQIATIAAAIYILSTIPVMAAAGTNEKTTFDGDLRIRYDARNVDGAPTDDIAKYRLRFNITSKLTDKLSLTARFSNGENEFSKMDGKLFWDHYYLTYKLPAYTVKAGRQDIKLFENLAANTTAWAGESTDNVAYAMFEGVMATGKYGSLDTTAFFGKMSNRAAVNKFDLQGIVLGTKADKVKLGAAFVGVGDAGTGHHFDRNFVSLNANTTVNKMYFGVEYVTGLDIAPQDSAWAAVLAYGGLKNVGDMYYKLEYRDVECGALVKNLTDRWKSSKQDYTFWSIEANKQLTKNAAGRIYYENYDFSTGKKKDENTLRGELVLKF